MALSPDFSAPAHRHRAAAAGLTLCMLVLALHARAGEPVQTPRPADSIPAAIVVGVVGNSLMPLEGIAQNRLTGFSGELLAQLMPEGTRITPRVYHRRDALLRAACAGEVDIVMSVAPRSQYDHCLLYSAPYLERPTAVVARADNTAVSRSPFFDGARLIVEQGSPLEEELPRQYPGVRLTSAPTPEQALDAVAQGRNDAYIGITYPIRQWMTQPRYQSLTIVQLINQRVDALHFAAPRRHDALIRRLDRQLAQWPEAAMRDLRARWLTPGGAPADLLSLSARERGILAALPPLRYAADSAYMPYTFDEQPDRLRGILPEYLHFLSRTLGIRFERVPIRDWPDALARAGAGEIDILLGLSDQDNRPPGFTLSHPLDVAPMVIVGRSDATAIASLSDLSSKTVTLPLTDALAHSLHQNVPQVRIETAISTGDALDQVAARRADFTIANLQVADAMIRRKFPGKLKVIGPANTTEAIGVGVSTRHRALVPLINRALFAMPEDERIRIRNTWLAAIDPLEPSTSTLVAKLGPAAVILLGALLMLFFEHMQLKRESRQRRHAEAALAQQLDFQRALMETVPFPLMATDAEHRYIAVNAAFCKFFGRTREAVLGYTPRQLGLVTAQQAARLEDIHRRAMTMDQSSREELLIVTPDGQQRSVLYWKEPLRIAPGQPSGVVASMVDVSEIREAQAHAERLEQRLREVTESVPALVFQFEMRPGQSRGRMIYAAGKISETFDTHGEDLLDYLSSPETLFHEHDRQRILDATLASGKYLTPLDQQFRHVLDDGSIRWLHARSIPHRAADGRVIWNGYLSDVTNERRQAEALEAAKNAAESALQAKDRFLATMSHEIRTPMNGVLGLVELLMQTRLDDEQRQMVSLVQESGRALLHILNDILDYAKIEAGRLAITPAPTDLRELFDSAAGLLASQAHAKSLAIRVDVDADVPAMVSADGIRMRQVLFNLLSNAIKFTDQGSVRLQAECTQHDANTASLAIHVTDTGIGIAPDVQATLFAPFVQAEQQATRRYDGTGLGLAISRQLAGLMGGTLEIMRSAPGIGTTLTLRLDLPILHAHYDLPRLRDATVRLDIADDASRRALEQFATAAGLRVLRNGPAALRLTDDDTQADAPDQRTLLITDAASSLGRLNASTPPRLSINPLNWQAFVQACTTALARPVTDQASATRPDDIPAPPATPHAAHILVAEDHPINRELIARQLRLLGYQVSLAEDGVAALERLRETRFDALLTDCHMPRMDGFDLAARIRQSETPGAPRLPIVAITATTLAEEHARCQETGMDAYLIKPTTLATLQEALAPLIRGSAASSAAS